MIRLTKFCTATCTKMRGYQSPDMVYLGYVARDSYVPSAEHLTTSSYRRLTHYIVNQSTNVDQKHPVPSTPEIGYPNNLLQKKTF